MIDVLRTSLLLDFYGQLVTKRRNEIMKMYYNGDYSLSEIADHLGISRQAVHDNIRQGMELFNRYENELGLVEKYIKQKNILNDIMIQMDTIMDSKNHDEIREDLKQLQGKIKLLTEMI